MKSKFMTVTFKPTTEVVDDPLCSNLPKKCSPTQTDHETNESHEFDVPDLPTVAISALFQRKTTKNFGQPWDEAWMPWDETNLPRMNTGNGWYEFKTSVPVVCFFGQGPLFK